MKSLSELAVLRMSISEAIDVLSSGIGFSNNVRNRLFRKVILNGTTTEIETIAPLLSEEQNIHYLKLLQYYISNENNYSRFINLLQSSPTEVVYRFLIQSTALIPTLVSTLNELNRRNVTLNFEHIVSMIQNSRLDYTTFQMVITGGTRFTPEQIQRLIFVAIQKPINFLLVEYLDHLNTLPYDSNQILGLIFGFSSHSNIVYYISQALFGLTRNDYLEYLLLHGQQNRPIYDIILTL